MPNEIQTSTKQDHRVDVDNGKYTFVIPADAYHVAVLRYGKPWHEQAEAGNALHMMMCELDAARLVVSRARTLIKNWSTGDQEHLKRALEQHDGLTSGRSPPSAWTDSFDPSGHAGLWSQTTAAGELRGVTHVNPAANPTTLGEVWVGNTKPPAALLKRFVATERQAFTDGLDELQRLRGEVCNLQSRVLELSHTAGQVEGMREGAVFTKRELARLEAQVAEFQEEREAVAPRLGGVPDDTFADGDGTARLEIERLRSEVERQMQERLRQADRNVDQIYQISLAHEDHTKELRAENARLRTALAKTQATPVWRASPPTPVEVSAQMWWWNKPADGVPHILQLDRDLGSGLIFDAGDSSSCPPPFDPSDWPGEWAPCMAPDDATGLSKKPSRAPLYSPHGVPLVWGGGRPKDGTVLTVECYCKWYELFIVRPDAISGIDFGVLAQYSNGESPYCDHAPNPKAVYRYAQAMGYHLDNEAFEMIIGRWEIEYHENYAVEQENRDVVAPPDRP